MAGKPIIYDELSAPAVKALINSGMDMAIMPVGATEQHGPHLPLNVDYFCAQSIALAVSAETGVPVFPALPIGHSGGHKGFPGTLSLRPETFQRVIEEIAEWAYETGFRRLLFLNGHLNNMPPLSGAIVNINVKFPDFLLRSLCWWEITPELLKEFFSDNSYGFPHGALVETSIMRYLRDDLVDMSKATKMGGQGEKLFFYYRMRQLTPCGHLGDPTKSTRELGDRLFRTAVAGLIPQIKAALVEKAPYEST